MEKRASAEEFPSISGYARSLLFPIHNTNQRWRQLEAKIQSRTSTEPFYLRDILTNPPAIFGRYVYERQTCLGIELVGKDSSGTNQWRKNKFSDETYAYVADKEDYS